VPLQRRVLDAPPDRSFLFRWNEKCREGRHAVADVLAATIPSTRPGKKTERGGPPGGCSTNHDNDEDETSAHQEAPHRLSPRGQTVAVVMTRLMASLLGKGASSRRKGEGVHVFLILPIFEQVDDVVVSVFSFRE
jgi:hypothetical protein